MADNADILQEMSGKQRTIALQSSLSDGAVKAGDEVAPEHVADQRLAAKPEVGPSPVVQDVAVAPTEPDVAPTPAVEPQTEELAAEEPLIVTKRSAEPVKPATKATTRGRSAGR